MITNTADLHHGKSLYQQGRLDEAGAVYESILGQDPQCADAWHGLGMIAIARRDHEDALHRLSTALQLDRDNPEIHHHFAVVHGRLGDFDTATTHYRDVIRLAPNHAEAYFNLPRITKFEPGDSFIDKVKQRIELKETADNDRAFLHFAAGKFYDDIQQSDDAFAHYRAANEARGVAFDVSATRQQFQDIAATLTPEWLDDNAYQGHAGPSPIFIVGMPRSGTSLVERILASHPRVTAGGERHDVQEIVQALSQHDPAQRRFPESLNGIHPNVITQCATELVRRLGELAPAADYVSSKNPTDFRYLGLIAAMLPNARILDVRRDARDSCLSCYFQNFRNGQEYSFDLAHLGSYYRLYEQLMQHWQVLLPQKILTISYESLVSDPEPVVRSMLDFCDLDWDPSCIEPHKTTGAVATASRWQVRNPINQSAISRWKRYEKHLGPLMATLQQST